MTSSPSNKRGFTLVELLAVITIIAIMVAVSIPAMRALQGTALQTGARQVQNELMLARQYAITQRLPVRFVICVGTNSMPDRGTNHVCRAYSIVAATNDVNNVLVGWTPVQDWRFLPEGVLFSDQNDRGGFYNPLTPDPMSITPGLPTVRNLGPASVASATWQHFSSTNEMAVYITTTTPTNWVSAYVEFKPTGQVNGISGAGGSIRIVNGAVADVITRSLIVTDTNNWFNIEYDQFGGRVRLRAPESYQ